jgi:hypothetical protein
MKQPTVHDFGQIIWNFVLPSTPDMKLKKLVKTNSTVAYIVQGINQHLFFFMFFF